MKILIKIAAVVTLLMFAGTIAQAGCLGCRPAVVQFAACGCCAPAGAMGLIGSGFGGGGFGSSGDNPLIHEPHWNQRDGRRYPIMPSSGDAANHTSLVPVVPGTVGLTYSRTSHSLPADRHPRTAMLAVRDQGAVKHLSVAGMGGFRMSEDVWLFEREVPLLSWTEDIVRVEARNSARDIEPYGSSFVRLIPGRIVYLDLD